MKSDGTIPPHDSILVRYGELGLKNSNRGLFEDQLRKNIDHRLKDYDCGHVVRFQGGMKVPLQQDSDLDGILSDLRDVPGIAWFAPCWESGRSPDDIARKILNCSGPTVTEKETFAISTQRSDKRLDRNSQEYNDRVGRIIDENTPLSVDLDDPDWDIRLHLLHDNAYVFFRRYDGLGGLPVEASGEVLGLLSGGIDSPVAAIRMFKRGCRQDFIHYYPYSSAEASLENKMKRLVQRLSDFGTVGRIFMLPYHVYDLHAPALEQRDEIILFRRHMMRMAQKLADKFGLKAIVSGSSLGQVASQTLENIDTICSVADLPVLRPLIGMDKQEIIQLAKKYRTYEISIEEYQDCCSITSSKVRTRSDRRRFESLEDQQQIDELDEAVLSATSVYEYDQGGVKPLNLSLTQTRTPQKS